MCANLLGETYYNVWLRDAADSCFFSGISADESDAVENAIAAYVEKYPEEYNRDDLDSLFVAMVA
jgi:hypothetical protein